MNNDQMMWHAKPTDNGFPLERSDIIDKKEKYKSARVSSRFFFWLSNILNVIFANSNTR